MGGVFENHFNNVSGGAGGDKGDEGDEDDAAVFISIGPVVLEGTGQLRRPRLPHADKLLLEGIASQN